MLPETASTISRRALKIRERTVFRGWSRTSAISVGDIQWVISMLRDRGIGVLITDHNVRETLGICDRAYILTEGRVLTAGTPDEILSNEDVREVYLGSSFRM